MPKSRRPDQPIEQPPDQQIEQPSVEPEVLPPIQARSETPKFGSWTWISFTTRDGRRRYQVSRPGPFATSVALLVIGVAGAVLFTAAFATALILIPLFAVAVGILLLSGRIKAYFRGRRR